MEVTSLYLHQNHPGLLWHACTKRQHWGGDEGVLIASGTPNDKSYRMEYSLDVFFDHIRRYLEQSMVR